LKKSGHLKKSIVFINPSKIPSKLQNQLKEIVKKHGGKLTSSSVKATHIIDKVDNLEGTEEDLDYLRYINSINRVLHTL
jgi:hypothetical protein